MKYAEKLLKLFRLPRSYLTLLTFVAIFIFSLKGLYGEDVWFHLATGRYIFEHHNIPVKDVFSFTAEGKLWINQGWLADLVFYVVYKLLGYTGLVVFFATLSTGVFVVLYKILGRVTTQGAGEHRPYINNLALFLTFAAAFVAIARFQLRPEVGSYLFLLLIIYILLKGRENTAGREDPAPTMGVLQYARTVFLLPVIFLLFANWQAGFVPFGVFILGVFLAYKGWITTKGAGRPRPYIAIFLTFLFSLFAIFLNPNGLTGVFYFIGVNPGYLTADFTEWGSMIKIFTQKGGFFAEKDAAFLNIGYFVFVLGLAACLAIYRNVILSEAKDLMRFFAKSNLAQNDNRKHLPGEVTFWLVVSLPFILLPLYANRFSSLAVIFIAMIIASLLKREARAPIYNSIRKRSQKIYTSFYINFAFSFKKMVFSLRKRTGLIMLFMGLVLFLVRVFIYPPTLTSFQKANPYRDELLDFIKKTGISGNMFNTLEDGGYITWKDPKLKTFMDGRLDVFTASGVYEDYSKIYSFPPHKDWQKILDKYKVEYLILPGWQKDPMTTIRKSKKYELVYWSDYVFLLVKKDGKNKKSVQDKFLSNIEPFKEEDYPNDKVEKAREEYERLKVLSPNSSNIAVSLASIYQQLGRKPEAINEYARGLKIKPEDGMTRLALGSLYFGEKECSKAEEQFLFTEKSRASMIKILSYRNLGFVYKNCFNNPPMSYYYFKKFLDSGKNYPLNQQLLMEAAQNMRELESLKRNVGNNE